MRTIKFRGKVKTTGMHFFVGLFIEGIWVYGEPHLYTKIPHIHISNNEKQPIDINTLGQFTGLTDKNDKEIYEGDIVKYYTLETITNDLTQPIENVIVERCGVITYDLSSFVIKDDDDYDVELKYYSKDYHVESPESVDAVNADEFPFITNENDLCKIEVIGNIHDNPELLKGE